MIRAAKDALGTIVGWIFYGLVEILWPKSKDARDNKESGHE